MEWDSFKFGFILSLIFTAYIDSHFLYTHAPPSLFLPPPSTQLFIVLCKLVISRHSESLSLKYLVANTLLSFNDS